MPSGSENLYRVANEWKDFFHISSGIDELVAIDKVSIKPRANGIAVETQETVQLSVYTLSGQRVYQSAVSGKVEIALNKGIYIIKVNNGSSKIIVW